MRGIFNPNILGFVYRFHIYLRKPTTNDQTKYKKTYPDNAFDFFARSLFNQTPSEFVHFLLALFLYIAHLFVLQLTESIARRVQLFSLLPFLLFFVLFFLSLHSELCQFIFPYNNMSHSTSVAQKKSPGERGLSMVNAYMLFVMSLNKTCDNCSLFLFVYLFGFALCVLFYSFM